MALINLRKHTGVAAGILVSTLVLLLLGGDLLRGWGRPSGRGAADVGRIAGQRITLQAYEDRVMQLRRRLPADAKVAEGMVRDQAWQQLVRQLSYQKAADALGLQVSADELVDMVQGAHPHPEVRAAFQHPETKQFDQQRLLAYLQTLTQKPADQERWHAFEHYLAGVRMQEKLTGLMQQSAFVTTSAARAQHAAAQDTLRVKCLYVPYHTASTPVPITAAMLQAHLRAHGADYQVATSCHFQYVAVPIHPTAADAQALEEVLQGLKKAFAQAKDLHSFAQYHTDTPQAQTLCQLAAGQLPKALACQRQWLKKGHVIGPVQEGGAYKLYRLVKYLPQAKQPYEVAVITKQLTAGNAAHEQAFRQADCCASTAQDAGQLAAYAAQAGWEVHKAQVGLTDAQVGNLPQARALVRWAHNKAAVGQVSPVFELGNTYVVAAMTKRVPAGTAPLVQVRDEVTLKVTNVHKAQAIGARLERGVGLTLEEQAAEYGEGARVFTVEALRFTDNILGPAGQARRAVGAAFALQPGQQTRVVEDQGVLVIATLARNKKEGAPAEIAALQQRLGQWVRYSVPWAVAQGLEELAQVQDKRHRWY